MLGCFSHKSLVESARICVALMTPCVETEKRCKYSLSTHINVNLNSLHTNLQTFTSSRKSGSSQHCRFVYRPTRQRTFEMAIVVTHPHPDPVLTALGECRKQRLRPSCRTSCEIICKFPTRQTPKTLHANGTSQRDAMLLNEAKSYRAICAYHCLKNRWVGWLKHRLSYSLDL